MSTNCVITIDHPNSVYNTGDILNGHVQLQTHKVKTIRGISIIIVGYEKVFWRESSGRFYTAYSADEKYLNVVTYVVGSSDGDLFDFAPGIYNYTFRCELPKHLPTSLTEEFGKIKYKVIVSINHDLKNDNVLKKVFIVNHISDLNDNSINRLPRHSYIEKKIAPFYGCCFCCIGWIRSVLMISCGGYVPEQEIQFQLTICNKSNNDLSDGEIKLRKCTKFTGAQERYKEVRQNIIVRKLAPIPRQTRREIKGNLHVPYLIATQRTKYIQVNYTVNVKISLGYNSMRIEIPVNIGTIPFDTSGIVPANNFNTSSINSNFQYNMNANNLSSVK